MQNDALESKCSAIKIKFRTFQSKSFGDIGLLGRAAFSMVNSACNAKSNQKEN